MWELEGWERWARPSGSRGVFGFVPFIVVFLNLYQRRNEVAVIGILSKLQ